MYEIVNKEGILRARFESKSDSDRYISAVAEISKYKDSLRANGDSDIDAFISANKELVDIYDIRSILHLLNAAITGSSQFKLTDRIVPLVRFFFSTNTQTADTSVFELFALFSKSEMQSLVKYFRNIHSKNPSFRTCRAHDVRQALLVFIVAASVSDFDQFLQARLDASYSEYEVFLLQNLQEPTNTFFEAVCALTQGFTLSSGLVALAIKASSWLSKKTQKTINIDIALKEELKNDVLTDPVLRLQNIALNIHTALGGDSQLDMYNFEHFYNISDFYSTTFDISKERLASALKDKEFKKFDSFFGRSSIPLARALKDAELLNFCSFLNPRTYIYTSSPQILAEFTQVTNSKYDSYTKNKDLCKAAFMVEDLTVVLLAYSLMSVIHILSQSAEAAQELSQRNFISYESALELCYDCASKVYKLSSKEIFDIYIKDLSLDRADPNKTLFEYQWPLLQEYLRTNADVLKYKIKDDLEMSQFIDFVEQNLQSYGRLLAYGTGSDASFCGLEIFLPGIDLDYIFRHNTESLVEFDKLKERFQKFSRSFDSEILSSKPMEGLQVVYKLLDSPIDHLSFLKYKDQMGVYSKTNAESSVSVYILCRRHPLNLFVGHSKVSNCCMYPGSVGFECSVSAFENAFLDFKNKSSTYIIVGYDHINESFIGSNWVYQIGAVKYLDSDNPSIVHSTAVDGLP